MATYRQKIKISINKIKKMTIIPMNHWGNNAYKY